MFARLLIVARSRESLSLKNHHLLAKYNPLVPWIGGGLVKRILRLSNGTVYFVTDQYIPGSIKSFERAKRSAAGAIRYRVEHLEINTLAV